MRVYADTSFLVKLLTQEAGTEAAISLYRELERPSLFYVLLHSLEVRNAILHRAFHLRHTIPSSAREMIRTERDKSFGLLQKLIARRAFIEVSADLDAAIFLARTLSEKHTERLGCRGFDILHVALALQLKTELFLTSDRIQGALAKAERLKVVISPNL